MDYAILTNDSMYTIFKCGDKVIRYRSPYSLEYYSEIVEWDNGYIVVMTKYSYDENLVEEFIDFESVLDNLYIDKSFLKSIREVVIKYD